MTARTCTNCGTPIAPYGRRTWCLDCFNAYATGSFHALGGLATTGIVGWLLAWWLS